MPRFILEIELGKMDPDPVIRNRRVMLYLKDAAFQISESGYTSLSDKLTDINGNTVGHYGVRE